MRGNENEEGPEGMKTKKRRIEKVQRSDPEEWPQKWRVD